MTQIFVFVSGNPDAQHHLADTIENPIDDEEMVFESFPTTYREDLESIRDEGSGFYAWGAVPGEMNTLRWKQMKPGDYVLSSYDNAYHHAARVLAKYDNRQFAEMVWGRDYEDRTWRYMYFLTEPVKVDRRVPEVADYLNAGYRGFTRIRSDKVDAIVSEFGSVDDFIHQVLQGPSGGTGATRVFTPVTRRDIEALDDDEDLDRIQVNRESTTLRKRLSELPRLKEGLDPKVRQTKGRERNAAFAVDIKKLYGFRCAVCGSELRTPKGNPEVQGAHVYPKGRDGSDDLRNGLCLCRRHHWAMDAGWFSIADDYTILVREDLPVQDDYQFIAEHDGESIRLPIVAEAAPDAMYLQEHRRLTGFE